MSAELFDAVPPAGFRKSFASSAFLLHKHHTVFRQLCKGKAHVDLEHSKSMRTPPPKRQFYMTPTTAKQLQRLSVPILLAFLLAFATSKMPLPSVFRSFLPAKARDAVTTLKPSQVSTVNSLGLRLFAALPEENTIISPLSIAAALTLAIEGTEPGSDAHKELTAILPSSVSKISSNDNAATLAVANAAWLGDVRDEYVTAVEKLRAEVRGLPKTADDINSWVSQATKGNINTLLNELPDPLVAILLNAVFFKAPWTTKFDKANTVTRPFQSAGNVKMMTMRKEKFGYKAIDADVGRLQVVEIPYGNGEFSAVCVVPGDGVPIEDVVAKLGDGEGVWKTWTEGLTKTTLDVLAMPRFKIEYGAVSLKDVLRGLGVKTAWVVNISDPPFKRMTDDREAYLGDVVHKASVECTEEGTVASAATAAVVMTRSLPRPNPTVVMDRPFLFSIRGGAGELLFIGKIDKPIEP